MCLIFYAPKRSSEGAMFIRIRARDYTLYMRDRNIRCQHGLLFSYVAFMTNANISALNWVKFLK